MKPVSVIFELLIVSLVAGALLVLPKVVSLTMAESSEKICRLDGYLLDDKGYDIEWSGRLIGTMVSGEEIGLRTISGTDSPVFDVSLGDGNNIDQLIPDTDLQKELIVTGHFYGYDCMLYRSIYGDNCVPLVEATSITVSN